MKIQIHGKGDRDCPYCKDGLRREATLPCLRCGVLLHEDCAQEISLCPILGCGGRFRIPVPAANVNTGFLPQIVAVATVLFAVGVFGFALSSSRESIPRPRRHVPRAAKPERVEFQGTESGPISVLPRTASLLRPGLVRLSLPTHHKGSSGLLVQVGDLLEGYAGQSQEDRVPFRLVAGESVRVEGGGDPVWLDVAYLEAQLFLKPPRNAVISQIRRADSGVAEEVVAARTMRALEEAGPKASRSARSVAFQIQLHDLSADEALERLPVEEREIVLQWAYDLLQRVPAARVGRLRAFQGFIPLASPKEFLPPRLTDLSRYDAFDSLRATKDSRAIEGLVHLYANLEDLAPSQALSLARLHEARGNPLLGSLEPLLRQLEASDSLFSRLLLIEHIRRLEPLLGRGLAAVHAEDGLLSPPAAAGRAARKVASWRAVVGEDFLSEEVGSLGSRGLLVTREVFRRGEIVTRLSVYARSHMGDGESLELLAAHVPHHPDLPELCRAARRSGFEHASAGARAEVWLAGANPRARFASLVSLPRDARDIAVDEAAHVLREERREEFWHALIEARVSEDHLAGVFRRLFERGRLRPRDLAAWCALVSKAKPDQIELVNTIGGTDALWAIAASHTQLDPRGWQAVVRVLLQQTINATETTERLLSMVQAPEARLAVLNCLAERFSSSATELAIRHSHREKVLWRQRAVELTIANLSGSRLEQQLKRALRDRSKEVRLSALAGLQAFALNPNYLAALAKRPELEVSRAAWLQLSKSDTQRALSLAQGWVRSPQPKRVLFVLDLAKELRKTRPTLSRELLRALSSRARDRQIRRQAAALLR